MVSASGPVFTRADERGRLREIFVSILARIAAKERWTKQRAVAKDGGVVKPESPLACAWSVLGALDRVCGGGSVGRYWAAWAIEVLAREVGCAPTYSGFAGWECAEERTHDEVVRAVDRARRNVEANGG